MKSQIKNNFDKAATSYDNYASIQKASSEHLAKMGVNLNFNFKSILDIGCGTGNTSIEFLKIYNNADITLCDISKKMVLTAQQKIPTTKYIVCDAEHYNFQYHYDLCISNLSLQWFENLNSFFAKIMNNCKYIAFSILIKGSFEEYNELLTKYKIETGYKYFAISKLEKIIKNYGDIIISDHKSYNLLFSKAFYAAKYFKYIGANYTTSQNPKSVSLLLSHKETINLKHNLYFAYLSRR